MKENNKINSIISDIKKTRDILHRIDNYYEKFKENEFKTLGRSTASAIVYAEIFDDFYTCLETLFLRISQYFENSLNNEKWHSDLLRKMTLEIEDTRKPVIKDETYMLLLEFLKFRHFRRYYFKFDYDWIKLEYLENRYNSVKNSVADELKEFIKFLEQLKNA